ncbi:hypothetical protein [Streptomyces ortus]|uniref:Uncharacterized protein n=1 Tax=Streptomyces ortus TaxID=2867268 RepID=A0ABT3UYS3_9ACTN|nr:hypothetical protein [Streptomyces ortus]MCX4232473.1 hypothetical protein [Streptomyces ortus]
MRKLTASENAHLKSFTELHECDSIDIFFENQGQWGEPEEPGALTAVFDGVSGFEGVVLDPGLERCMVGISDLSSCWGTVDTLPRLRGEFSIKEFFDCLLDPPPELVREEPAPAEAEFYSQLRVIDSAPRAANGMMTAVRIQPGVNSLEIYFIDSGLDRTPEYENEYIRMDVDYCGYLDALLMTKGTFGWQYLFTEASSRDERFRDFSDRLAYMLELFPRIFPEYDYTPLRDRLEARR